MYVKRLASYLVIPLIAAVMGFVNISCGSVASDLTCQSVVASLSLVSLPSSAPAGDVTINVQYQFCDDYLNGTMWLAVVNPDDSYSYESVTITSNMASGTYAFTHDFATAGTYTVWAGASKGTGSNGDGEPFGDVYSTTSRINITGGSLTAAFVAAAESYCNYSLTWFNRDANITTDENGPQTEWTSSVPYSLVNYDVAAAIAKNVNAWAQPNQTRWYQYSPGKPAYNYNDLDNVGNSSYPWPVNTFSDWTGTNCQGLLYNCAVEAGYTSFTSDNNYINNVDAWANLGTWPKTRCKTI